MTTKPGNSFRCCIAAVAAMLALAAPVAEADDPGFPKIPAGFNSKTLSYPLRGETIDYGGRLRVVFDEGMLYRRRDSVCYDYYFLGRGRLTALDTSGLGISWQYRFPDRNTVEFTSAYICGWDFEQYLNVDPAGWREDKLRRPQWKELQFLVKIPDRYFGVNLSGELVLWPQTNGFRLPVWVDLGMNDDRQVVLYLSPGLIEQLGVYAYDNRFNDPYLLADFNIRHAIDIDRIDIDSSDIAVELNESGKFAAVCKIFFAPETTTRGIGFILPALHDVDSVLDADGGELDFVKDKWRTGFYVAPRPVVPGKPDMIAVYFRGKFIEARYNGVDFPANVATWFPHLPERQLGRFTVHYTLHKDLDLISVGKKIAETVVDDRRTVSYATDDISYISFASGVYDTLFDTAQGIPLTLFVRRENNRGIFNRHIPGGVMDDLRAACSSFYEWWGPPVAGDIRIVDHPWGNGISSPGLIHLSQVSFNTSRDQARFRAHEVAHQWWGHTVVPKTFSEAWLSEGMAEHAAAMYLLRVAQDSSAFRELIERWRRHVVEEGRLYGHYSRGFKAGPITTGSRFLLSYSPGDYIALVYSKAAYMLRMLRFEIDGPLYRTDFFNMMLAEYRRQYSGQQVTNADFIRIVRRYIGDRRADDFFGQWLYGWKIPDFICRYNVKPDDKNRPVLYVRITVAGVDEDFETPFPVEVELADGSRQLYRLDGVGVHGDFMLGPFPQPIENVRFDPDRIILSRGVEVVVP